MEKVPQEIQVGLDELAGIAKAARNARRLTNAQVARAAFISRYPITRLNSGGWLRSGLSKDTLHAILVVALDVPEDTWARAEQLFDTVDEWRRLQRGRPGRTTHVDDATHIVRFGRMRPDQDGRPYASIDRFDLEVWPSGHVEGLIERIEPESRRGATWECAGRMTPETLLLTFWPAISTDGSAQSDSTGQILVQREQSKRRAWPGALFKLSRRPGEIPMLRQYDFFLSPLDDPKLVDAASAVAVLDFDNTLARGWVVRPWLQALAHAGVGASAGALERFDQLFATYAELPSFTHDDLANEVARVYATAMTDVKPDSLTALADAFANRYVASDGELFPAARELLSRLRLRGVKPILVTGAPLEVIDPIMRELEIEAGFPLVLEVAGGRFTGEVAINRGLASVKRAVCESLVERQECELLVAVGDSDGDRPMWEAATTSVRVGGESDATGVSIAGVSLERPLEPDFWRQIPTATWIGELRQADAG